MSRMRAFAAVCAVGIAYSTAAFCKAEKQPPTIALYQHFDQSDRKFSVVDQLKLHSDGTYDQSKQTSAFTAPEALAPTSPKPDVDDPPRGNPPKDAGVEAWKNPSRYWAKHPSQSDCADPPVYYDTDPSPKRLQGTWRFLPKPGGAAAPLPKTVADVPDGSVVEFNQAMPLGPVGKIWAKTTLLIPAKEFDYYHTF